MKENDSLAARLSAYAENGRDPYHMPGHKRNPDILYGAEDENGGDAVRNALRAAFRIDITEIPGFDDLHDPQDILKKEMDAAAAFYGTDATFFSVNGSTAANLAALWAAVPDGAAVLLPENAHRSLVHAAMLRHCRCIPLPTQRGFSVLRDGGPADADRIRKLLAENPEIRLVVITSPTYDGILSDIRRIAEIAHAHDALLLVDEAHGAHLPMHPLFPGSAIEHGADLVVQSLHKTLPALTQTALLHSVTGRVSKEALNEALDIFETSSPSYVLMASVTECLHFLYKEKDGEVFGAYLENLMDLRAGLSRLQNLAVMHFPALIDPGRILLGVGETGLAGPELAGILRERFGIECEYAKPDYVLLITSVGDTKEMYERLLAAVRRIDEEYAPADEEAEEE